MVRLFRCLIPVCLAALVGCQPSRPEAISGQIVDLSYSYDQDTIFWPTAEGFKLEVVFKGENPLGFHYEANNFSTAEHGGTHLDAPAHFYQGRHTVDAIPLERLVGPGIVIDVSEQCSRDRDYLVAIDDFIAWEKTHGEPIDGKIVLLRTGFGRFWPDREQYMGTAELGPQAVAKLHFPGLHPEAEKWLTESRKIKAIGLDTPSIDYGQSSRFQSHVTLFGANIPAFENVANLELLPDLGFTLIALPMKIRGGSGGPLRIVAILPE